MDESFISNHTNKRRRIRVRRTEIQREIQTPPKRNASRETVKQVL
jgi:hypothetical protein